MRLSTGVTINAIITALVGLASVIIPGIMASIYGINSDPALEYVSRLWGCALLGYSVLAWAVRKITDLTAKQWVLVTMMVSNVAGFAVTLAGQLTKTVNWLGWVTVALSGIFAVFYYIKSRDKRLIAFETGWY